MAGCRLPLVVSTAASDQLSPVLMGRVMMASRGGLGRTMRAMLHLVSPDRIVVHAFVLALLLSPRVSALLARGGPVVAVALTRSIGLPQSERLATRLENWDRGISAPLGCSPSRGSRASRTSRWRSPITIQPVSSSRKRHRGMASQ